MSGSRTKKLRYAFEMRYGDRFTYGTKQYKSMWRKFKKLYRPGMPIV